MKRRRKIVISSSFLKGYARALSVYSSNNYPDLLNDRYKDYQALRGDWSIVGETIKTETRAYAGSIHQ